MDCRVPQSCSLVMERPGPSSPEILSPEKFSPVSGKVLDGRDGLLGCLVAGSNASLTLTPTQRSPPGISPPLSLTPEQVPLHSSQSPPSQLGRTESESMVSTADRCGGPRVPVNGRLSGRGGDGSKKNGSVITRQIGAPLSFVHPLHIYRAPSDSLTSSSRNQLHTRPHNRQIPLPDVDLSLWTKPEYWRAQGHQNWDNISQEDDYCERDYDGIQKWGDTAEESINIYLERREAGSLH